MLSQTHPVPTSAELVDDLVPGVRVLLLDETRYASGSHKEPAARAVVTKARADGYGRVIVGSCGSYGRAMATACAAAGLHCTVVLPADWGDGGSFAETAGADVRFVNGGYEDAVEESHRLALAEEAADGNVDGPYQESVLSGHGEIVSTVYQMLGGADAALWIPAGNGTTIVAAGRQLAALNWPVPVHGVGSPGNNPIVTSWPGPYRTLPAEQVVTTVHNEPLVNWDALHGPGALTVITTSGGAVHAATDDDLLAAQALLARYRRYASPSGAAGLAGLLAHTRFARPDVVQVVLLTGR